MKQSELTELKRFEGIQVYETNLALGYNERAYFVHYMDNCYLCVALKIQLEQKSFAVGWLCKFADHEIQHILPSEFKLTDSTLWNAPFIGWLLNNLDRTPTLPVEIKTAEEIKSVILSRIKELKTFMHNQDDAKIKNSYYVSIQHMYGLIRDFDAQFKPTPAEDKGIEGEPINITISAKRIGLCIDLIDGKFAITLNGSKLYTEQEVWLSQKEGELREENERLKSVIIEISECRYNDPIGKPIRLAIDALKTKE